MKVFSEIKLPTKSALSKFRNRISYKFFEEIFFSSILKFESKTSKWNNLRVYAIDGIQLLLPRTNDIIKNGYNGRAVSRYRDTYGPRMYLTAQFDVLNRFVKNFKQHSNLDEISDAESMVKTMEKDSLIF